MTIDNLYEQIAQNIQDGLNATSEVFEFSVKTMYNEQRPDNPNIYVGTLSYTPADIIPLAGIKVLELNGSVSFVVKKEQAEEINAVLQSWLGSQQGVISAVGAYSCIPAYETTSRGDISLTGQMGETISLSFFATWRLVQNAVLTNACTTFLDGAQLPVTQRSLAKIKSFTSDNQANNPILEAQPTAQSVAFEYTAYLTTDFADLISEIRNIGVTSLKQTHTLVETINGEEISYNVMLTNGSILGVIGGVMTCQLSFTVARPAPTTTTE